MFNDSIPEGITMLIHERITIEGLNIFGSPYTPTYGNWSFMKAREKIGRVWEVLPSGLDILITHGPPKGILDLTEDPEYNLLYCGDGALRKKVEKVKTRWFVFHDSVRFDQRSTH